MMMFIMFMEINDKQKNVLGKDLEEVYKGQPNPTKI